MTRDLLGSGSCRGGGDQSLEVDLDLQVPNGWEKRLDLKVRSCMLCSFALFVFIKIVSFLTKYLYIY